MNRAKFAAADNIIKCIYKAPHEMTASKYFIRKDIKKPFFFGHCAAAGAIKPLRNRRMTASAHVLLSPLGACQQTVYCCAMTHPQLLHPEARERRTTDSSTNRVQNCFCLYSQLMSLCLTWKHNLCIFSENIFSVETKVGSIWMMWGMSLCWILCWAHYEETKQNTLDLLLTAAR